MRSTNTWKVFGERTITITHNADGTYSANKSGSFTTTATGTYSLKSGSASVKVAPATIPRASQPTLSNGSINIGSTTTVYMNRVSTAFTHYVYAVWGDKRVEIGSNITNEVNFTLPLNFCDNIPSSTSGTGTIYVDTYSGGTYIGTKTVGFTGYVPDSVQPGIGDINISEGNTNVPNWGCFIQGKSTLNINIGTWGAYSSWITSCKVTGIDNNTYWSSNFTSSVLQISGTRTITVTVTDSRGRTASKTATYTCVAYSNPSISVASVARCNSDGTNNEEGTYVKYTFKATISAVSNKNTYAYKLGYKKTTDSSYTYITIENNAYSLDKSGVIISGETFSVDNSYDFQFFVSDYFTSTTNVQHVATGFTLMDFRSTGKGMAIGKVSEKDKLEIALEGELYEGQNYIKNLRNSYYFGVKNPAKWVYIGEFNLGNQGSYAVINCYFGNGQNGNPDQNTHAIILLKQGWTGMDLPIGVTTNYTQNFNSSVKIKILHTSKTSCKLYIYLPWAYNDLTITLDGSYNSCSIVNEDLSTEPTTDKESAYYDLTTSSKAKISNRNTTDTWIPVFRDGYFDYTLRQMPNSVTHTDWPYDQDWLTTRAFLSFWNGAYNGSNNSNLYWCSDGAIQAKPVVAYANESGTTGTVTLSVSAGNYNHIRITYKNSDGQYGATTISGTGGISCTTYGSITRRTTSGNTFMANSALFAVSGRTITPSRNMQSNMANGGSINTNDANYLAITKVELWN